MSQTKILIKLIIVGDAKVGKTALQKQYVNKTFSPVYRATIGADFESINNGKATVQIWDTAGQERFQALGVAFYRGADAAIFVFDLHDRASFEHLDAWKERFNEGASLDSIPLLLIGNKSDVEADRVVTQEEIDAWTSANGDVSYVETSATDYESVAKAFDLITTIVIKNRPVYDDEYSEDSTTKADSDKDDEYESLDDPKDEGDSYKSVDEYESLDETKDEGDSGKYSSVDEYESLDETKDEGDSGKYSSVDEYESIDDPKPKGEADVPDEKEEPKVSSLLIDEDPKKEEPKPVLVEIVDEAPVSVPKPRSSPPAPIKKTPVSAPPKVTPSPTNASAASSSTWSLQDLLIPALAAAIIVTVIYIDYRRKN